jgi:hypothetical protein
MKATAPARNASWMGCRGLNRTEANADEIGGIQLVGDAAATEA